jgi:hypothetical protein
MEAKSTVVIRESGQTAQDGVEGYRSCIGGGDTRGMPYIRKRQDNEIISNFSMEERRVTHCRMTPLMLTVLRPSLVHQLMQLIMQLFIHVIVQAMSDRL